MGWKTAFLILFSCLLFSLIVETLALQEKKQPPHLPKEDGKLAFLKRHKQVVCVYWPIIACMFVLITMANGVLNR